MSSSPATPFEQLGGEPVVKRVVERFYDLMDLEPRFTHLRQRLQQSLFNTADWMRNQEEVTPLQPLA